jgi:lipopolysaccharide assembly outer membrane protein LptD (OstA)
MNKIYLSIFSIFIILFNQILKLNANDDTYINSSNITYNEKENIIELSKNSKINYKNTNILINKGVIDYNNNKFEVFGSFYLYEDLTILSGQNLKGNTSLDNFTANKVSYIYNDDLKIDSDNLKRENNLLYFYNNFLTPCELEGYFNCPTWSLRIDKTEYNIEEDKFTHFDTFLQIADYKVFYLPYFTHYGAKAPRKKGFLTPSMEYNINGNLAIITPYYYPINNSSDIIFKPKIFLSQNFELLENFQMNTFLNSKRKGGDTSIEIDNIKKNNKSNINTSIRFDATNVISKKKIISAKGLFTNSISSTRSKNEESITFEDIYIRLENYDFLYKNDYLKVELASIESYESSNNNSIPISPRLNYSNQLELKNKYLNNELNFIVLKRNNSNQLNSSESIKLNLLNELTFNKISKNLISFDKVGFINSISEYYYNDNSSMNSNSIKSNIYYSKDIFYQNLNNITPRIKLILPFEINNSNKSINEDSHTITFNYQNQYKENRFFGYDKFDNSPRVVYGLENQVEIIDQKISLNLNQSYDFKSNNSYNYLVNQSTNFSDFSMEANTSHKNFIFKIDSRLDKKNFSKKEMNYSFSAGGPINLTLNYHETNTKAFKHLTKDTQNLDFTISKKLNDNFKTSYTTSLDLKNNYDQYKSSLGLSILDECSQFEIIYSNTRFNDSYNTQPEEKISLSLHLDYLGFFGYEQTTDLFFSKPGKF